MNNYIITGYCIALLLAGSSCNRGGADFDRPLVTVGDKTLTEHELAASIPANSSLADSAMIADDYIKRWINSELMLNKALLNLTKEEQNIEKLIEQYRQSLLVTLYQQKLLEQKYAPMITDSEIREYYEEMKENFVLKENLAKGLLAVIPKSAPKLDDFKKWLRLRDGDDIINAKAYMLQYGVASDDFLDKWISLSSINAQLPSPIKSEVSVLKYQKQYETEDEKNYYFLAIKEALYADDIEPLEYSTDKIKSILLNKKRFEFIKQLEEDIYNEGLEQKIIKFH